MCELHPLLSGDESRSLQEFSLREHTSRLFRIHEKVSLRRCCVCKEPEQELQNLMKKSIFISLYIYHRKDHQKIDTKKGRFAAYRTIEWTQPRVNELFTMYTNEPLSMQCNRSDGGRFEGFRWENAPITLVPQQLPKVHIS